MAQEDYKFIVEAPEAGVVTIWMANYNSITQIGELPADMVPGSLITIEQTRKKEFSLDGNKR